jgi:hypothetical protein
MAQWQNSFISCAILFIKQIIFKFSDAESYSSYQQSKEKLFHDSFPRGLPQNWKGQISEKFCPVPLIYTHV